MKRVFIAMVVLGVAACAGKRSSVPGIPVDVEQPAEVELVSRTIVDEDSAAAAAAAAAAHWSAVLSMVSPLVGAGAYLQADSILGAFSLQKDASCHAAEANYTRAILLLTPSNPHRSVSLALPLLDGYLASTCLAQDRAVQVALLRSMAGGMSGQTASADSAGVGQLRKLQAQLDEVRKELERLKMRIIPPPLSNPE
jgi:hypothetical protein